MKLRTIKKFKAMVKALKAKIKKDEKSADHEISHMTVVMV